VTRRNFTLLLLAALIGAAIGAVAQFPAARAVALVDPAGVDIAGVQGTVWQGSAERVTVPDMPPLAAVRWNITTWQLLLGRLAGDVRFDLGGGTGATEFRVSAGGAVEVRDAHFEGRAAGVARHLPIPLLLVEGDLTAMIESAALRDGRPEGVDARLRWSNAVLRQPLDVDLGAVSIAVTPADEAAHRLVVDVREGALNVRGGGDIDAAGRYDVELRVEPQANASAEIVDMLANVAERDGDVYVIRQRGQLPF
jgi:general secretion pathway protein N